MGGEGGLWPNDYNIALGVGLSEPPKVIVNVGYARPLHGKNPLSSI